MPPPPAEHLTPGQVAGFRERTLPPDERLALDEHLASCEACRGLLRRDASTGASLRRFEEGLFAGEAGDEGHLTYEEMAAYLDGTADPILQEIVGGHADVCDACRDELAGLRRAQSAIALAGGETLGPTPRPPVVKGQTERWPSLRWHLATASASVSLTVLFMAFVLRPSPTAAVRESPETARRLAAMEKRQEELEKEGEEKGRLLEKAADRTRAAVGRAATLAAEKLRLEEESQDLRRRLAAAPAQKGERVVAVTEHGRLLRKGGRLMLEKPVAPADESFIEAALTRGRLAYSVDQERRLRELAGREQTTAGGGGGDVRRIRTLRPVGTAVLGRTPTLAWEPVAGAARYEVRLLYVANGAEVFPPVSLTRRADGTWSSDPGEDGAAVEWAVPVSSSLRRGTTYSWSVTAYDAAGAELLSSGVNRSTMFRVLSEGEAAKVPESLRQYAPSPLLRALFLARWLLLDDAEDGLRGLARDEGSDGVAHRLLEDLRRRRRPSC